MSLCLFSSKYQSKIIDGKKIAAQIQTEIKYDIQKWLAKGNRGPHLSVLLVGDNPASAVYVNNKLKAAQKTGILMNRFVAFLSILYLTLKKDSFLYERSNNK